MLGYYMDPTYILVLIGALICIGASAYLRSTYGKYARVNCRCGLTGAEMAARILKRAGITDVTIQHVRGDLTDHYDPGKKVLRLSDSVYSSRSIAAIGVAAHECGHALQHREGYVPLVLRTVLLPAANIGSMLGLPLVILGLILGLSFPLPGGMIFSLVDIGIWIFAIAVIFQLITLPVEFNASGQALRLLGDCGLGSEEVAECRRVLTAAALTYVAAAAASILQLLRLVLLSNNRRDRR